MYLDKFMFMFAGALLTAFFSVPVHFYYSLRLHKIKRELDAKDALFINIIKLQHCFDEYYGFFLKQASMEIEKKGRSEFTDDDTIQIGEKYMRHFDVFRNKINEGLPLINNIVLNRLPKLQEEISGWVENYNKIYSLDMVNNSYKLKDLQQNFDSTSKSIEKLLSAINKKYPDK